MVMLTVTQKTEDQYGGYGYGVRNMERERNLEFCAAMNMAVALRASHLDSYESGSSKAQVDYCLVRRIQRKFLKM